MLRNNLYPYESVRSVEGKTILTRGKNVRIRSSASATSAIKRTVPASGTAVGKCQGRVWYDSDPKYKWYEIEGGGFIRNDLATLTGNSVPAPTATAPKNADEEAQMELDAIVSQDKETMNNLNSAAAMIETLKTKGVATTTSANRIKSIFSRLQERQEAMKKTTWGKVKDTVSNAWGSVKRFFGFNGMGVLPIVIIAGIALVAGAGTTALVMIKPWKNQSNIDLKESKELKAMLENADPVVAQKIREDIKTQLVDAYTTGNRQGSVSGFLSIGKYILIAGAALWIAPKVMDYFAKAAKSKDEGHLSL
jgi:hypothetical protein